MRSQIYAGENIYRERAIRRANDCSLGRHARKRSYALSIAQMKGRTRNARPTKEKPGSADHRTTKARPPDTSCPSASRM
jgi:hypothetical protein